MNQTWHCQQVPIKIQLGDKTLLAPRLLLQVREAGLDDEALPVAEPIVPADPLHEGSQGFLIRSLRITGPQPVLRQQGVYLCYVPAQYPRYYIDMQQSFAEYKGKFSAKTRSTISRKIRKYTEHCGGSISWRVYRSPGEMAEFFRLARIVSRISYQERLFDEGLPDSEEFCRGVEQLAGEDRVRGFILFYQDKPISYLYCPVINGVLIYAFLGYDPGYMNFSVGTVLQWLALEYLFEERKFRFFDFTEGQSEHKKLFATHSIQCANVFFLRNNIQNRFLLHGQRTVDYISNAIGDKLDELGLKSRLKKMMRFGI
ncbi:MAG: GNAT family N-acetyltransferase [Nitrosospira multiformis]|nr:GNAT family N-acetyltransferase [Nitrosospira multiformis]